MKPTARTWNPANYYKNRAVAEDYDASRFSSLAGRLFNALEKRTIRKGFAGLPAGAVISDVPCGTGRLAEPLLQEGFQVIGVDVSAEMLEVAARRLSAFGERFRTEVHDARLLPEAGLRFDGALCARVLMHFPLPEQIRFLKAVRSVTAGRVVFTQGLDTPYHRLRRWLKVRLGHQRPADYPLRPHEVRQLIDGAGLREIARYKVFPLVSESVVFVTEVVPPSQP